MQPAHIPYSTQHTAHSTQHTAHTAHTNTAHSTQHTQHTQHHTNTNNSTMHNNKLNTKAGSTLTGAGAAEEAKPFDRIANSNAQDSYSRELHITGRHVIAEVGKLLALLDVVLSPYSGGQDMYDACDSAGRILSKVEALRTRHEARRELEMEAEEATQE